MATIIDICQFTDGKQECSTGLTLFARDKNWSKNAWQNLECSREYAPW